MEAHPDQRDLEPDHVEVLRNQWGESIESIGNHSPQYQITVIAEARDDHTPPLDKVIFQQMCYGGLNNNHDFHLMGKYRFCIILGQHRVEVLVGTLIRLLTMDEDHPATREDATADPRACWQALVFGPGTSYYKIY